jgi:hypothetical protein
VWLQRPEQVISRSAILQHNSYARLPANSWTIHGIGWAAEATLGGRQMRNSKEVVMAVSERLRIKESESFRNGIFEPVLSLSKCCNVLNVMTCRWNKLVTFDVVITFDLMIMTRAYYLMYMLRTFKYGRPVFV